MTTWGVFPESPKLDHITDTEAMLCRDFHFESPDGSLWTAPEGMVFDGTSIPSVFWTFFRESPFTGDASWAAIIHDAGCKGMVLLDNRVLTPAGLRDGRVHDTFYRGIRARGGDPVKAWLFYRVVWAFGMTKGGYTR